MPAAHIRSVVAGAALLSLASLPALAQGEPADRGANPSGAQPSDEAVQNIVVTATKRRERVRDVADSVSTVSGATMDQRRQVNLQSLAAEIPGLSLETDSRAAVRIVLRGLNAGSAGSTVASVLDDVPVTASGAQTNAAINTANFDTFDLSQIDVLRGPQGTLYGATAEGGIVRYVTNGPDLRKYAGTFESGIDGIPGGTVGGSFKGYVNIPLLKDVAAVRVSAWNSWLPGYVDNPATQTTNSNTGQQYGYRVSLLVQPRPWLKLRLFAQRQSLFTDNTDYVQTVGAALTPTAPPANQLARVDGLANSTPYASPSQNESGVYYADLSADLGPATLSSITSYVFNNYRRALDLSTMNLLPGVDYGTYLGTYVYGTPTALVEKQGSNLGKFNEEVRLVSDPGQTVLGRRFDWLAGFLYTHETTALLEDFDARGGDGATLSPAAGGEGIVARLAEWSAYGSVDYFLWRNFDIQLGGRVEGNTQYSQTQSICCVLTGGPTAFLAPVGSNEHAGLYSIAPRWRLGHDTLLYARIASGFRPGGPNIPVPGFPELPTTYGPDHSVNYEIGIRQDLFDRKVAIDVTGYWVNWHNVQVLSLVNTSAGAFGVNGNAGEAQSKGVEWNLAWLPLPGLRIEAVGDYAHATLTRDAPGLGGRSGDTLPYVPAVSTSVNVDYRWALTQKLEAYVSGTWSYTGVRHAGFVAPADPVVNVSHVRLPAYSTGAIRGGVSWGGYDTELFIDNIGNARGITYYNSSGGAAQTGQASVIQPRTVGAVFRARF